MKVPESTAQVNLPGLGGQAQRFRNGAVATAWRALTGVARAPIIPRTEVVFLLNTAAIAMLNATIRFCRAIRQTAICSLAACGLLLVGGLLPAAEPAADVAAPPKNTADLKVLESRIKKVIAKVTPSVVSIGGGSGVIISEDGYVLTVAHVNEKADKPTRVMFADGRRAEAITLGSDHGLDAGLAKIVEKGPWPHIEMGTSDDLRPGQWCLTLGYPVMFERGRAPVVRIGRVLRSSYRVVTTDCTIMGGDSGAPLFNLDGKIIAIGSKCDDVLVSNFHVPVDRYRELWNCLVAREDFDTLKPALLGIRPAEEADDARIGAIIPGSAADKAGLKEGDVILHFDGKPVKIYNDLPPLVRQLHPGHRTKVEYRRDGALLQMTVTLGRDEG
jgi:serine protease Do